MNDKITIKFAGIVAEIVGTRPAIAAIFAAGVLIWAMSSINI